MSTTAKRRTAPAVMKLPPLVPEDVSDLKSDAGEGLQLSEAKTGPYRPSDRLRLVGRALKACRKNVIASAKVLIATLATVGSDDIRKYWAPDRSHQVWAEIDEATTIPEVMFYVPHANCYSTWGKRIVSTVQYGDHRQLGPLTLVSVLRRREGSKSWEEAALNPFGAQ